MDYGTERLDSAQAKAWRAQDWPAPAAVWTGTPAADLARAADALNHHARDLAALAALSLDLPARAVLTEDLTLAISALRDPARAGSLDQTTATPLVLIPAGVLPSALIGAAVPALAAGRAAVLRVAPKALPLAHALLAVMALPEGALVVQSGDAVPGPDLAFIIHADADLDAVADALCDRYWPLNPRPVRLIVQEGVTDAFIARLNARLARLRMGDPLALDSDLAPLPPAPDLAARIAAAGGMLSGRICTGLGPATLPETDQPVGFILTFRLPPEAVALAENHPGPMAVSLWSESVEPALNTAFSLRIQSVALNGLPGTVTEAGCLRLRQNGVQIDLPAGQRSTETAGY
ncbi:MAG: aldehyde dehydrogenase family protein [Paracoccus sp. (in: a-proteobacteria)]|uniref:aldehyde dehydrogenase family protein n=1 Tax=Paracoccus sp. TaxID=267 RepID=UPI0026DFA945|nr:aldehyde dehydrogenase family protein [Paracoccus sp. (in: a-proteobacteria)]MDO5620760.1 aldehyde dehydrogenase family protein [Paracoccus sp. (in: a-proteobacteria)]